MSAHHALVFGGNGPDSNRRHGRRPSLQLVNLLAMTSQEPTVSEHAATHQRVFCLDFLEMFRSFFECLDCWGGCLDSFGNVETFLKCYVFCWNVKT